MFSSRMIKAIFVFIFFLSNFSFYQPQAFAQQGLSAREARNEEMDKEAERIMSEFALHRRWAEEECKRCDEEAQKRCANLIMKLEELADEARSFKDNYTKQQDAMKKNAEDILKQLAQFAQDAGMADAAGQAARAAAEIAAGTFIGSAIGGPAGAVGGFIFGVGMAVANIAMDMMSKHVDSKEKDWILEQAKRQGEEIAKAGKLIQQFEDLEKEIETSITNLKLMRKNCKKPTPETGKGVDKGAEVSKVDVTDSTTGEPLGGDTIVIPKNPKDATKKVEKDSTYVPKEGDTVVVSAPCHQKESYIVGKDPFPKNVSLKPRPFRFFVQCEDYEAMENIRKGLAEQNVTFSPECVKKKGPVNLSHKFSPRSSTTSYCYDIIDIECYTIGKDKQYDFPKCPDSVRVNPGPVTDPSQPGWFEPDYWREGQEKAKAKGKAAQPSSQDPFYSSNATWGQCYDDQWGLKRIGFSSEGAEGLWPKYAEPVTVAVIDTGIDMYHPDLLGATWINTKEIPANNKDDDNNGYIDDVHGWNFVDENNNIADNNGHGTIVAGIIAAWTGNGVGISGVNPWARIMPVKATDFNNKGWSINLARAIIYAVDNGARVINISIGGETLSQAEKAALDYAKGKGVLVVVASGNKGINTKDFSPAGFENVITVSSTDVNDNRVNFSNWGKQVDIAAPGTDILSLRALGTDYLVLEREAYKPGLGIAGKDRQYYRTSGSSFSAPFVSGVASLILSENPKLTADQVKNMVVYSAKDVDVPGRDQYTGYGLLDAKLALSADPSYFLEVQIDGLKLVQGGNNYFEVNGTVDADKLKAAWLEIGQGANPLNWEKISKEISSPVKKGLLGAIPLEKVSGGNEWTVRLIAEHKNGKKQEVRYMLNLK